MLLPRRRASAVEVIWPPRPWAVSGGTGHHALSPPQGLRGRSRSCGSASRRAMSHGRVWRHDALAPSLGQRGRSMSISCVSASRRATQAVSVGAMTLLSRTVAAGSHTRSASMSHVAALRANKRYSSGGGDGVAAVAAAAGRAAVPRIWIRYGNVREFGVARETIRKCCLLLIILVYFEIRLPGDRDKSAK